MNLRVVASGVLVGCAACSTATAASWDLFPFGEIGGYYESNLGLNPVSGQQVKVDGAEAGLGVGLVANTPKSTFILRPRLQSTYFPGQRDFDYNNSYADLNYNYKGLRSTATVVSEYSHEIVDSAAQPGTTPLGDLGNPRDGDVSNATTHSRRDSFGFYPTAKFAITQRGSLDLSVNYVDVSYDQKLPGEELGYKETRGGVGWSYDYSVRSSFTITALTQKFDPEDAPGFAPSVGSTSNGLTIRWTRMFSEKRQYYLLGGATRTKFDSVAGAPGDSANDYVAGLGARWEYQRSLLFVDVVHRLQPSSSGLVSNQTDARLQYIRNYSARWRSTFGARAIIAKPVNSGVATDDRKFDVASANLEWRWTRKLSVVGDYQFIHQKLENQGGANTSRVTLSIAYDAGRKEKE